MNSVPFAFCDSVFASFPCPGIVFEKITQLDLEKNSVWLAVAQNHLDNYLNLHFAVHLTLEGIFYSFRHYSTDGMTSYSFEKVRKMNKKYLKIETVEITDIPDTNTFAVDEKSLVKIIKYIRPTMCLCDLRLLLPDSSSNDHLGKILAPLEESVFWGIEIREYSKVTIDFLMKLLVTECPRYVNVHFQCSDELQATLQKYYPKKHCFNPMTGTHYTRSRLPIWRAETLTLKVLILTAENSIRKFDDIQRTLKDFNPRSEVQSWERPDSHDIVVFLPAVILLVAILCYIAFQLVFFSN
uniref:Uncharacterized protein n=1 Tax=Steinernema glaseri TaxID=37863 RepID=A0A1I7Z3R4_9BILA